MEERTKDKKVVGIFLLHYWGHSIPLLRIAEHLHQNCEDMEIIVYGSETLKGKIEELFSCLRVEYIEDGIYQGIFSQQLITKGTAYIFSVIVPKMWDKYFSSLSPKFDLIITDMFNVSATTFAEKHKIKLIVNHAFPYQHIKEGQSFLNIKNSWGAGGFTITHPPLISSFFFDWIGFKKIYYKYHRRSLMIFDSFFGFDTPDVIPPHIKLVGMLETAKPKPLEDASLLAWMDKKRGENKHKFIYASFGSMIKPSKNLLKRIYQGLKAVGLPIIWALKEKEHQIDDENFYIRDWLPQTAILSLPEVLVFVSHGGWNSVTESISHEKPLAIIGFCTDQIDNGKIVQRNGCGVAIYTNYNPWPKYEFQLPALTSQMVSSGINRIIENQEQFQRTISWMRKLNQKQYGVPKVRKIVQDTLQFGYDHLIDHRFAKNSERSTFSTINLLIVFLLVLVMSLVLFAVFG